MPKEYENHRQFIYCKEFLGHYEWELALQSLIELTQESEHYFSEEFWNELARAANLMNLRTEENFCFEQLEKNSKELPFNTPFGWTTKKTDGSAYQHFISEKLKQEWTEKRRKKDQVDKLINQEGVHLKSYGRGGYIYYTKKGRLAELEYELGTQGIIIYFDSVKGWSLPSPKSFQENEKELFRKDLSQWSVQKGHALDWD